MDLFSKFKLLDQFWAYQGAVTSWVSLTHKNKRVQGVLDHITLPKGGPWAILRSFLSLFPNFVGKKKFEIKKFGGQKKIWSKKFWVKNFWGSNFWVGKNFLGLKKFWRSKFSGVNIILGLKFLGSKFFGVKIFFLYFHQIFNSKPN